MPLGQAAGGAKPQRKRSTAKALITASDFTFLGGFKLGTNFARGLTWRKVNGTRYLYTTTYFNGGWFLNEFTEPTLTSSILTYNTANLTSYGSVDMSQQWAPTVAATTMAFDKYYVIVTVGTTDFVAVGSPANAPGYVFRATGTPTGTGTVKEVEFAEPWGLYWDEPSQKMLYFGHGDYAANAYPVGIGTPNFEAKTFSQNRWHRPSILGFKGQKGVCKVPAEARTRLGAHRRLALGFGGYQSVVSNSGYLGPALAVFDPDPLLAATPYTDVNVDGVVCMSHPFNNNGQGGFGPPYRGLRTPDVYRPYTPGVDTDGIYTGKLDLEQPPWSVGFGAEGQYAWMGGDAIRQNGIWIETPNKKGFLCWILNEYDGDKANVTSYTETGSTGNGEGDRVTYNITLDSPMERAAPSVFLAVRNSNGLFSKSIIQSVDGTKTQLTIELWGSAQQNPGQRVSIAENALVYFGSVYFSGAGEASFHAANLYTYDPESLYQNVNPTPPGVISPWLMNNNLGHVGFASDPAYRVNAVTFDDESNLLWILDDFGYVKKYAFTP